ncbi:hypothetical protein FCM35_KLT16843 [Carex littledalei]|uniref:Uncharacterized protein n=1 Tax=Carex littledalei TaxID=544730 RepID=A0A833VGQ3_9POAL|nr:hypothetical protein FCM35_KLT16843 [Carex littledalei]
MDYSSSDGAVNAEEGDIETGDAASELQKKIQNDSRLKCLLVGLAWIMYPLYQRLRKKEDEVQESVQSLLQVVERVAQVTEKLATDIAEALPSNHNLKGAVETVSQIAHKVEKDAETAQAFVQMVDDLGDELDEYLNPLIKIGDTFILDKKAKKENKDQLELTLDAKL